MAEREQRPDESERTSDDQPIDAGAFVGHEPELAMDTVPGGVRRGDERIAGNASESTGVANRGANPDEGWQDWPEGHREGRSADDDLIRRKG